METATLVAIFISGLLVSFTGYALYTAFGQDGPLEIFLLLLRLIFPKKWIPL